MNDFVICNEEKIETKQLGELSRKKLGLLSDEWWNIEEGISLIQLEQLVKERENMDVLYMDGESFYESEELHKKNQWYETAYTSDYDYGICDKGVELFSIFFEHLTTFTFN